ncbi:MAG: sigma-70 family RNA polymerase sigma factor [Phycisphaerae bacterium]|nr:sigma-70 family RNA polymerase sigma factor [Phycisphaerae bacterium]
MNERDADIVARCLKGYETAYADLYSAHAGRVRVYLLRCGFAPADADDLTQETFLQVFRSLRGFDVARGSFLAWISNIARNVARKWWRKLAHPENFDPHLAEETFAVDAASGSSAEAVLREEFASLGTRVEGLEETPAQLVHLRYVEGLTTRGIGEALGMPEAAVRMRLNEIRDQLLRELQNQGVEI